ncbi:MAG: uroporphyrinogen decarboxylase family protein [Kiritimatiellae bacterium]|nr:uroporphyrinogen decarboxylase family protein [Kiritimatiellia bacterium]
MNSRERVIAALEHKEPDILPMQDGIWEAAINAWHAQGLPRNVKWGSPENYSFTKYFRFDVARFGIDLSARLPERVIEAGKDYNLEVTRDGSVIKRVKDASSIIVKNAIGGRNDWEKFKLRLRPEADRFNEKAGNFENFGRAREANKFTAFYAATGVDRFQNIVKIDDLLVLMMEDPESARDMFKTVAQLIIGSCELLRQKGYAFDGLWLCNDMGYKNASLISPTLYRELMFKNDKLLCDYAHQTNMKVIYHSCGYVAELIPDLIEAGVDCLHPLEVKAGMDVVKLKKMYKGKLAFMGGIETSRFNSPAEIEEEIAGKLPVAMAGGGYIYHSDHSIPPSVELKNYLYALETIRKYGRY